MTSGKRPAWAAFALSNLLFLRVWYELNHLQRDPVEQYWLGRPAAGADFAAAIAGALLLALILLPLTSAMHQRNRPVVAATGVALASCLLARAIYMAAGLSEQVPEILWWRIQDAAGSFWFSGLTIASVLPCCLLLIALPRSRAWLARAGPALVVALSILAPFGIAMMAAAAVHGIQADDLFPAPPRAATVRAHVPAAKAPRVIVMVFDELDYRLAFVTPPQDLALKGLRRLRASSLFATHAFPPSNATALSMPSMLAGERFVNIQADGWNRLGLYRENGERILFGDTDTLLHRAARNGHRIGILGWYHPYCRVFSMAADCLESAGYGYSTSYPASDLLDIVIAQWRQIVPAGRPYARQRFEDSVSRFRDMLADHSLGLVFAHFAVPHFPYIYDAGRESLAPADLWAPAPSGTVSYFSNLLLVDRLIEETLDTMKASCSGCILVVTSDHWWRWSRHHDGRTDRRVPFAVYTGSESGPAVIEQKFNIEFLAHFVMALLQRELLTRADMAQWIERNGRPRSPVFAPWMLDEDRAATSLDPPSTPLPGANPSR